MRSLDRIPAAAASGMPPKAMISSFEGDRQTFDETNDPSGLLVFFK
jgi:hypothetical protein